ncbi:MAG: SUMF1/EgtB/PvdO family nonheme iron enzyme [Verrucomicrobia bacterium]|nr:SUMF1/EgtB/PvdO family nonheme iron enzyme [Verrucomicrobiota bacterium]
MKPRRPFQFLRRFAPSGVAADVRRRISDHSPRVRLFTSATTRSFERAALFASVVLWVAAAPPAVLAAELDFNQHIKPILESACLSCHGPEKPKGGLRLDTKANTMKGGENGIVIVPGQPEKSPLYTSTIVPPDDDKIMPPKGDKLTKEQSDLLRDWIKAGANWPDGVTLAKVQRINFVKDIQPILELDCVSCHHEGHAKGKLRLDNKADAFKSGKPGPAIIPWNPGKSSLYTTTVLPADNDDLMPPKDKGGPLSKETTELLKEWISQGAVWPDGITLTQRKKEEAPGADELPLITEIHHQILANLTVTNEAGMKPYTNTIPGTSVDYAMVPIHGGDFAMGSPENEPGRKPDEGPQHKVTIDPFWMGQCEVTWSEYELFMYPEMAKRAATALGQKESPLIDAVSRPTRPYVEMSFGMGKEGFPAISMTQHGANKYCQWLSAKTGQFYRLPTEAEWEYACRAGTTTAYSFGDDSAQLDDYAWYGKNSDSKYQKVGQKKPNPWGLYDMHGNVAEWTLDQYDPDFYKQLNGTVAQNPWNKATKPYPHVVRGGSWDDPPDLLRSAARLGSSKSWKVQDPQLPKSIWYHTDAQFLGFRIIRPLKVPPPEELQKYWTSGVEKD